MTDFVPGNYILRMDARSLRMNRASICALRLESGGGVSIEPGPEAGKLVLRRDDGGIPFKGAVTEPTVLGEIARQSGMELSEGRQYVIECEYANGALVMDLAGVVREK